MTDANTKPSGPHSPGGRFGVLGRLRRLIGTPKIVSLDDNYNWRP